MSSTTMLVKRLEICFDQLCSTSVHPKPFQTGCIVVAIQISRIGLTCSCNLFVVCRGGPLEGGEDPDPCQKGAQAWLGQEEHRQASQRQGGVCDCGPVPVCSGHHPASGKGLLQFHPLSCGAHSFITILVRVTNCCPQSY